MGKKDQEEGFDSFIKTEFLDLETNKIPAGFTAVERYPLKPPFSYAVILKENETGRFLYLVDEVKMNDSERIIYEKLYSLIEQNLEAPDTANKQTRFSAHLTEIIKENQKVFEAYPLASLEKVKYYLERDIAGFGTIDALMHDLNIEDISCSGINTPIYIWHRVYDSLPTNIHFEDEKLNSFVTRIVFRAGKHISSAFPISDLALEGNHRISVLYQKEVTPKGTSFTIRKFREDPYTIVDLISFGSISTDIAAYLWMLMESKMSILVIGSTGSGKTTILNAIIGLINPDFKIFSVEDVAEININHENWFSLISRTGFGSGGEGEIGLYDLIKSGVRHRPDYIVVGEIRGSEAYVMFQAMATGHGGLCTMHADSLESAAKRLQQKPMDIPPAYLSLMNCAIVIRRLKEKETGQSSRKAVSVQEIKSADSFNTVFSWNVRTNDFDEDVKGSIMLQKIAQQGGMTPNEVLAEYERRKKVLKWLADNGIRSYKQVAEVIGKYYRDPASILQKIE
jgi:flagellar protein FlaI